MNKTLTRRGFVSMLVSVPIVAVAVPKIFLPESEYERDIRIFCEYVRKMQDLLFAEMLVSTRVPWSDEGWPLFKEAYKDSIDIQVSARHVTQHTLNALEYCRLPGVRFDLEPLA